MNHVNGIPPADGARAVDQVSPIASGKPASGAMDVSDVVEISDVARLAAEAQHIPEVRAELVERVKAEMAAGTYETPERIEAAVDRLMEELGGKL